MRRLINFHGKERRQALWRYYKHGGRVPSRQRQGNYLARRAAWWMFWRMF